MNKEQLIERVRELEGLTGSTVDTEGLTKADLEGAVAGLESQLPAEPVAEVEPESESLNAKTGHVVAPGQSLVCGPRGCIGSGESISVEDFKSVTGSVAKSPDIQAWAERDFEIHVKAGRIVKA